MVAAFRLTAWDGPSGAEDCCAYLIENGHSERCGDPCALGSSYCPVHHEITHLALGSQAEAARFRGFNTIATIVGGRMGKGAMNPLPGEIEELERRQIIAMLGPRRLGRAGRPSKLRP
jgi:hypothetical protein